MKIEFGIKGMSCKNCSNKIEAGLKEIEGVHQAHVKLEEDKASITFDSKKTSEKEIKEKIRGLGYNIEGEESKNETKKTVLQAISYGLIPHLGCFAFILASLLGITFAAEIFRPLMLNPLFFYGLIGLSLVFATISSAIYLKKNHLLSFKGIKKKTGYLTVMYGTTLGVSLLLLFIIFPMLTSTSITTQEKSTSPQLGGEIPPQGPTTLQVTPQTINLQVQLPCTGHTTFMQNEIQKLNGILSVKVMQWNEFQLNYDSTKTTPQQILSAEIFKNYPAKIG